MAKVVDPHNLPPPSVSVPGLKEPVWDFSPTDDADPSEVDAFNKLIRMLRDHDRPGRDTPDEHSPR